jgi:AcrR family transcriptional regulator
VTPRGVTAAVRPGGRRVHSDRAGAVGVGSALAQRRVGGQARAGSRVAGIQRSRILAATVAVVDERGYADTRVAAIVARSRVSRRTFYELFANREECLAAVLADAVARLEIELAEVGLAGLGWRERLRRGLWVVLSFLDREPVLARVCVVHALAGGATVAARRKEILARLAAVVDEGRFEGGRGDRHAGLTAEGLVGAAFMIVYARLATPNEREPLCELWGELLGLIVMPYLGAAAARHERARPAPSAPPAAPGDSDVDGPVEGRPVDDPLCGLDMRLTYRTARVLEGVRRQPGGSNRQVAELAGITDPGQVSKLLRRLERLGLLENGGGGHAQGEPNAWCLTSRGRLVAESIRVHGGFDGEAA